MTAGAAGAHVVARDRDAAAPHADVMAALARRLYGIVGAIPVGAEIVYVDVPLYFNVGDLLINAGTESLFRAMGVRPTVRLTLFDACAVDWKASSVTLKPGFFRALRRAPSAAPIVLQGGGNLGDLYPELQGMREAIVAACPRRRVVILPQSLHFDDPARQDAGLRKMLAHDDLYIFLRDRPSLDAVRAVSPCHGTLMPDMAHALWEDLAGSRATPASVAGPLVMGRRDGERRAAVGDAWRRANEGARRSTGMTSSARSTPWPFD